MRTNHESGRHSGVEMFAGNKVGILTLALTGAFSIVDGMPNYVMLDPGGSDRVITLPAVSRGLYYKIYNTADAAGEELSIKNVGATLTLGVISQGESIEVFSDGVTWFAFGGGRANPQAQGLLKQATVATPLATAGAATYTIAQLLTGFLPRDCAGASRTDVFPTAALALAGCPNAKVGDCVDTIISNVSDGAETITITAGSGGTLFAGIAEAIIARDAAKIARLRFTNVTTSSEAYDLYI